MNIFGESEKTATTTHIADPTIHYGQTNIDHTNLLNIGVRTHAVIDNDISTNTTDILTNAGNISTNTTDISTNTSNISTNTTDILTNTSNISTNTSAIATNAFNIITNTSAIATNVSNIATNASNISTNASNISTNTSAIATNTTDIATNASSIATNTTDIATNASSITTNTAAIALNTDHRQNNPDIHLPRNDILLPSANTLWSSEKINNEIQAVAGTSGVTSVAGKTGAVTLNTADVAEDHSNLYFTNDRVGNAPSVTANTAHRTGLIYSHSQIDNHIDTPDIHLPRNDILLPSANTLWSSQKIQNELNLKHNTADSLIVPIGQYVETGLITAGAGADELKIEANDVNINDTSLVIPGSANPLLPISTTRDLVINGNVFADNINLTNGVGDNTTITADDVSTDILKVKTITRDLGVDYPTVPVTEFGNDGYIANASQSWGTASKEYLSFNAFDKIDTTFWQSNDPIGDPRYNGGYNGTVITNGYAGEFIQIQLPAPISVGSYTIKFPSNSPNFESAPEDFRLFIGSSPTGPWTQIHDVSGEDWGGETVYELKYNTDDAVTSGAYIRLAVKRVIKITNGGSVKITELKFNTQIIDPTVTFLRAIDTTDILSTGTITAPSVVTTTDLTTELIKTPFTIGGTVDVIAGGGTINLNATGGGGGTINLSAGDINANGLISAKNNVKVFKPSGAFSHELIYNGTEDKTLELNLVHSIPGGVGTSIPPNFTAVKNNQKSFTLTDASGTWTISQASVSFRNWNITNAVDPDLVETFFRSAESLYVASSGVYAGGESTDGYSGDWVQFQFPQPYEISGYTIYPRNDAEGVGFQQFGQYSAPKRFKMFVSNTGTPGSWVQVGDEQIGIDWPDASSKTFNFTPTQGTYWRLVTNETQGSGTGPGARSDSDHVGFGDIRFTTTEECPSSGCLILGTKTDVQGDLHGGNAEFSGTGNIGGNLTVAGVLQDVDQGAYIVKITNNGADILPSTSAYTATIPLTNFVNITSALPLVSKQKNMGIDLSVQIPGIYRIDVCLSYSLSVKAGISYLLFSGGTSIASTISDEEKDNKTVTTFSGIGIMDIGDKVELFVGAVGSSFQYNIFGGSISCYRICDNG